MPFPFAPLRIILLVSVVITKVILSVLCIVAFREKTGGVFQVLAMCICILSLLTVIGCLCHQFAHREEEASNTRNLIMFGICGLLGFALAISLTVHARQAGGMGICNDFAKARNPCLPADVQLGMTYVSPVFALVGFVVSWIDRFPGAVKVTSRYPITKAPSSHFAAYAHDLDGSYTRPPVKTSPRSRNNSGWSDVPLDR